MIKKFLFLLVCLCIFKVGADEFLQKKDIHRVMEQILQQQGKTGLSATILKRAFDIYLEQFDPEKRYLLAKEFSLLGEPDSQTLEKMVAASKEGLYSEFEAIQDTIQKAIFRARGIRERLYAKKGVLIEEARAAPTQLPFFKTYSQNEEELAARIRDKLIVFIANERKQGGKQLEVLLKLFEKQERNFENNYLGVDQQGNPLPLQEKENLYVLHVLKSLAKSLDAHTDFYSSQEAYDMRVRLEKETQGLGIVVAEGDDGTLVVQKIVSGGPAERSGLIQVKDKIVEVNDRLVAKEPKNQILELLRGKKTGSEVRLKLQREIDGSDIRTLNVTLNTEEIPIKEGRVDVSSYPTAGGIIGRIALHSFYQGEEAINSESDVKNAITQLSQEKPLKGLVLDLRDNFGGFLTQAVKVGGLFISDGIIVISKYFNGEKHIYRDLDNKDIYTGPMVVLISKLTASAAEIVAAALQDYGVALIVGDERSFGKGTIQSQTVTGSGQRSYFKVTVGKYYTVSGKTPQLGGVKADIVIPGKYNDERIGEEFLDRPLPQDKIQANYEDSLKDVDPSVKSWYLRYYMPNIQKKEDKWEALLPTLRRNSQKRIQENERYQKILELEKNSPQGMNQWGKELDELQLQEAVNIVQDMIHLSK